MKTIRWSISIAALAAILVGGWYLFGGASRFDAAKPRPQATALSPIPVQQSTFTLPISVPIATVTAALEHAVPPQESGSKNNVLGKPAVESMLTWSFDRSALRVMGGSNALSVAADIGGNLRVKGVVQIIRGDIGNILNKIGLNPTRIPFSIHAELDAGASITRLLHKSRDVVVTQALAFRVARA